MLQWECVWEWDMIYMIWDKMTFNDYDYDNDKDKDNDNDKDDIW